MTGIRDLVCRAIAALPQTCTIQNVEDALEPLLQSPSDETEILRVNDIKGITPLMVACDRGNVACLEYLKKKLDDDSAGSSWLSRCIGTPLGRSEGEQNTAMHHAAMAGCFAAISILSSMGAPTVLVLGSARNSHGDTPLMMAATSGHVEFCKAWQEMCIGSADDDCNKVAKKDILEAWECTNDSNDSCLSLACGHGHVQVVEFLLSSDCGVYVNSKMVIQCQSLYQRMETALRRNPSLTQTHRDQARRVQLCLEKLEAEVARTAELVAEELLRSETVTTPAESSSSGAKSSKSKPRKKNKGRSAAPKSQALLLDQQTKTNGDTSDAKGSTVQLMTLPDGTKAVRVEGSSPLTTTPMSGTDTLIQPLTRSQRSADEMFRERFQQGQISSEVDSVMQALCLDMKMLLYTPHLMAIDLSPSQLDAIEEILKRQLKAVNDARAIQERLHKTSQSSRPEGGHEKAK